MQQGDSQGYRSPSGTYQLVTMQSGMSFNPETGIW